jgi:hypothetical protein
MRHAPTADAVYQTELPASTRATAAVVRLATTAFAEHASKEETLAAETLTVARGSGAPLRSTGADNVASRPVSNVEPVAYVVAD